MWNESSRTRPDRSTQGERGDAGEPNTPRWWFVASTTPEQPRAHEQEREGVAGRVGPRYLTTSGPGRLSPVGRAPIVREAPGGAGDPGPAPPTEAKENALIYITVKKKLKPGTADAYLAASKAVHRRDARRVRQQVLRALPQRRRPRHDPDHRGVRRRGGWRGARQNTSTSSRGWTATRSSTLPNVPTSSTSMSRIATAGTRCRSSRSRTAALAPRDRAACVGPSKGA